MFSGHNVGTPPRIRSVGFNFYEGVLFQMSGKLGFDSELTATEVAEGLGLPVGTVRRFARWQVVTRNERRHYVLGDSVRAILRFYSFAGREAEELALFNREIASLLSELHKETRQVQHRGG
jgi:hypothetical protein